ncbi:MAG: hypothetical protein K0S23_3605 [Fluviicola sp.]|jgi:hypothetical protein|uniref:T9SS type A sorting domain-containing protein n=1 Tax=Fluviicola sp. TaxID=1917219 RepID=UPI002622DE7A|nr:T9SS type A sorting domain-containing protein [Fluviicola sp.]MDF3029298.1 hypothetical protein [Fluviicola sp.]
MKKQITLLSGLLLVTSAFGQVKSNLPVQQKAHLPISVYNGKTKTQNGNTVKADGDLLFDDDFAQTSFIWTAGTSGQGTFAFGTNASAGVTSSNQYMGGPMASTTAANGFAYFNGVQYLLTSSAAPQNTWVMSDTIDLSLAGGSITLAFQQRYRAFNTDVTYVEFSEDGGLTWPKSFEVNAGEPGNGATVQNTIALDFAVANSAYSVVRFRWENTSTSATFGSGYGWYVDDITINAGYGNNMKMTEANFYAGDQFLQYTKFPIAQSNGTVEVVFDAVVSNKGYNSQNANLTVTSGAYNQTGSDVAVAAFAADSTVEVSATPFMLPTTLGTHTFTYKVASSNNSLVLTTDDTLVNSVELTNSVMAVDAYVNANSISSSFLGWATQSGDPAIGSLMEIFADAEASAIQIGIYDFAAAQQTPYIGLTVFGRIDKYNPATDEFDYIGQTEELHGGHEIAAGDFGNIIVSHFDNPITLTPGLYLVTASMLDGAEVPIAFSGYVPVGQTAGLNGANVTTLAGADGFSNYVEAAVVRLDFTDYAGMTELNSATDVTVYPNPFVGTTEIKFNLKSDAEVSVVITDVAGRTVATVPASTMNAGEQTIAIDGTNFVAGIYNYTLTVGNETITKRIVKK